ncbi:cytochrome p450 [Diplodia corticola]|uniref:Cytochrome p450 n=1 Tax=Diplodia corticola TaxID=236234 RepID=A0A1J9QUY0_9PEZI|nr:cytochrome p450 [Diplodia corticola]OJD32240.1 cytochrome p450 [Diplodia corticola]
MSLGLVSFAGEVNVSAVLAAVIAISLVYLVYFLDEKPYKGFPVIGLDKNGFFKMAKARAAWIVNGCEILEQGAKQFSGAFQVITASGPKIVLPNRYANEIRNNPHMSFGKIITREFFSCYPGFEPFDTLNQDAIIQDAIKNKLTQSLTLFTSDISTEVTAVLSSILDGNAAKEDDAGWAETPLRALVARVIAQVTSRVFLGPHLSQDPEWLSLCTNYAVTAFAAQQALLSWSPILRPLVHRFLAPCRQLRALTAVGRRVIGPHLAGASKGEGAETAAAAAAAAAKGDMIAWMEELARERRREFNFADAQIMLAIAAIHTTSEAYVWVVADLIEHPEYAGALREEVASVLGDGGWRKDSLARMKLLDSFIKESHRRHMVDALVMDRYVEKTVTLSDGLTIPAGSALMVHATNNLDEKFWPNAKGFDGYRFLRLRERAGEENRHQLVTTSAEHLGFGLGLHACPGRFFAANTMKLLLAQFVMKYDWKFVDEKPQLRAAFGSSVYVNPMLKVAARRRKEEVRI